MIFFQKYFYYIDTIFFKMSFAISCVVKLFSIFIDYYYRLFCTFGLLHVI